MVAYDNWYKENDTDKVWWLDNTDDTVGEFVFSFDKKTRFNLFSDRGKLTPEQRAIFYKENPLWREYFEGK